MAVGDVSRFATKAVLVLCLAQWIDLVGGNQVLAEPTPSRPEPSRQVTASDLPRIPYTDAIDSLETFRQARGFELELVAAEPLVADPVAACFDEYGRMYVAEMHGYPFSQEPTQLNPAGGGKKDAGIIRLLEDTNGDGRMDRSVVFADQISWPTSVVSYNGGVFVIAPQYLYYFKDSDGDLQADVREVILSGFGRGNVQSMSNGLHWGLDNKVYFASGRNPKELRHRGQPLEVTGGMDLRFDPATEVFEPVTGGLQYGHSMDAWGTRFVCSNSNHIQQVVYPQYYLDRNPYFAASDPIRSIAEDGASARVFRISPPEPWRIIRQKWRAADKGYELVVNADGGWEFLPLDPSKPKGAVPTEYPVGFFTSASGVTIYRGNAYPAEYRGNAFVGDVGGNLVHRKRLDSSGVIYRAERADPEEEFVRSTDNWFRPVNFVNAPDGTLWILDMYRETIEHPHSIPEEIKQHLDLTSGFNRGRIYRMVSPEMIRTRPLRLGDMDCDQLVAQLESDNGWNRTTAQRLLFERQDRQAVSGLIQLLTSSKNPFGRLHALYTLQGLGALEPDHIREGLRDEHPRVRAQSVVLSESWLRRSAELKDDLLSLCDDDSEHVRFRLALALGEMADPSGIDGLARMAAAPRNGKVIQTALFTSMGDSAGQVAVALIGDPMFLDQPHAVEIVKRLASMIGANSDPGQSRRLLVALTEGSVPMRIEQATIAGLGEGLVQRGSTFSALLATGTDSSFLRNRIESLFKRAADVALEDTQLLATREIAVGLLAYATLDFIEPILPVVLSPRVPQSLQRAAVYALGKHDSEAIPGMLLESWSGFSPVVRRAVVDVISTRPAGIQELLAAIEAGKVHRAEIELDNKQTLLRHPDEEIRARSQQILGADVSTDRARVVTEFQEVLELDSDVNRGLAVFKQRCAVCHRAGDIGHQVAPDLASVKNKSTADLLIAILDPNREAQPTFNVYTAVTEDGRLFTGVIASESANSITLRRAEAKEDVLLRNRIEELSSTGLSLMPEGLEKELSRQDLADVIAFVKSISAADSQSGQD